MQIKTLGWSGGIGANLRTTCFLIDDDILIDAGTGLGDLPLNQMTGIRHIFLTHSHIDHVTGLPLLADTMFGVHEEPIVVYALEETIEAVKQHVFNWVIWPDFTKLPSQEHPTVRFEAIKPGDKISIRHRSVEMIEVNHTVPGVGYCLSARRATVAFSGDTTTNDNLWQVLNEYPQVDLMFVEAAFSNNDIEISRLSKHYCPSLLGEDIVKMKHRPEIWMTHFKPGEEELIYQQCVEAMPEFKVNRLTGGEVFKF